jgi:hypothetical protein
LCSQIVLPLQDRVVFLLVASCQIRLTVFGLAECADQIPLSKSSPALVRAVSELGRRFGHQGAHRTNRFFSVVLALSLAPSLPCRLLFAGSVSSWPRELLDPSIFGSSPFFPLSVSGFRVTRFVAPARFPLKRLGLRPAMLTPGAEFSADLSIILAPIFLLIWVLSWPVSLAQSSLHRLISGFDCRKGWLGHVFIFGSAEFIFHHRF